MLTAQMPLTVLTATQNIFHAPGLFTQYMTVDCAVSLVKGLYVGSCTVADRIQCEKDTVLLNV